MTVTLTRQPERLHYTGEEESERLIAADPFALLVGFALDQQVTVQKAFSGPLEIRRRVGTLDPARLAAMDPGELSAAFRQRPTIHRFPDAMARRVQALAQFITDRYGGDASRIWTEAADGADLRRRLAELPSFGEMKVRSMTAVLAKRFGLSLPGLDAVLPPHMTLGDVDSPEALEAYQAAKRARKAELRAAGTQESALASAPPLPK
ncbi:MAG TPA: HhH-GPD-type base excision DNA repair protein [candidate division Zixibacteria bacterium]|nr:HhH-GPD-type base excision DNA repair protein [candidate division Zixibacteria bacterium]